ncbi:MAG: RDD family protein [Flectobacillus sp.]|uniref:RDD family protein n=1 Tax=Flectobacillus sp. TaxID=50419 RepID=UPI003B9C105A
MSKIKIRTAQNVEVAFTPASIGDRIIAYLIDLVVFFAWIILFSLIASGLNDRIFSDRIGTIFFFAIGIIPLMFYDLVCEIWFNGQSIGKRARNIKVIKLDGSAPTISAYILRWLFRLIDMSLFGPWVSVIAIAAGGKGQRLGDLVAGTTVIRIEPKVSLDLLRQPVLDEAYEVMIPEVSLLSDADIEIIRQVIQRYKEINDTRLVGQTAQKLKEIMQVESALDDYAFLEQILSDHTFLMAYGDES